MRLFILTSHYPFANILLGKLIKTHHQHIGGIFIERTPLSKLIKKLFKQSGWRYAFYIIFETVLCWISLRLKRFFGIAKVMSLRRLARNFNIPIQIISDAQKDNFIEKFKSFAPDLLFLVDYNRIAKNSLLAVAKLGTINFHPGLLPKYKGVAPIFFILLNKENRFGATIHKVSEKIDGGDVVSELNLKTDLEESLSHHRLMLCLQGADFISGTIGDIIKNNRISGVPQNGQVLIGQALCGQA